MPRAAGAALLSIGLQLDAQALPIKSRNLKAAVKLGARSYQALVKANNGVRYDNLKKLVASLGTDWRLFEQGLSTELADLDALGSKRGEVGHLSPFSNKSVQVTPRVYPDDVRGWVANGRVAACGRTLSGGGSSGRDRRSRNLRARRRLIWQATPSRPLSPLATEAQTCGCRDLACRVGSSLVAEGQEVNRRRRNGRLARRVASAEASHHRHSPTERELASLSMSPWSQGRRRGPLDSLFKAEGTSR